jgi:hypothetical protein
VACCAGAAAVVVSGCQPGDAVCPAVGYSSSLTVQLSESWAPVQDPAVAVSCPDDASCALEAPAPDGPGVWRVSLTSAPARLVVTVTDGGAVVAEVPVRPTWRVVERPHGPDCGGPVAADVVLDLPE